MKRDSAKLADYIAGFLSNLAVAGAALALFKEDESSIVLAISALSVLFGGVLSYFRGGVK